MSTSLLDTDPDDPPHLPISTDPTNDDPPLHSPSPSPSLSPSHNHDSPRAPTKDQHPRTLLSTLTYFTDPISYTTTSLLRRLSTDDAPTPLAKALSANWNGSMAASDPLTSAYHPTPPPPPRKRSPFQPPPLTPLTLHGYDASTRRAGRLLSAPLAEEIRLLIPPRLQLQHDWRLTYSLAQHGSTVSTLYKTCAAHGGKRGGFVLVVRDAQHAVFGAYLSDPPAPHPHYFGTGECFLWRALRLPALPDRSALPPPPSADTTHATRMTTVAMSRPASTSSRSDLDPSRAEDGAGVVGSSTPERIRFKAFPFTGENDFSIFCQPGFLSVGGGDGRYGLWLDGGLGKGVSDTCPTFGNEALSEEGTKFDVLGVEVWYIGS